MPERNTDDLKQELMTAPDLGKFIEKNRKYFQERDMASLIKEVFRRKHMSKSALAARANISEVYLHQVFAGQRRLSRDLLKRCVRRAGIQETNFHALRHTFATRALEHGMDVVTLSRILGHANPSITLDKYGHAQEEQKKRSINQMGDIYQHTTEQQLAAQEAEIALPKLSWG